MSNNTKYNSLYEFTFERYRDAYTAWVATPSVDLIKFLQQHYPHVIVEWRMSQ